MTSVATLRPHLHSIGARISHGELKRRTSTFSKNSGIASKALARFSDLENPRPLKKMTVKDKVDVRMPVVLVRSQIIESINFSDITKFITKRSLILLDLDNTVIETLQTLGSDQWFRWRIGFQKEQGLNDSDALETALMEWVSIQCLTKVKLVEEGTAKVISFMQSGGYNLMGLTTRGASLATRTNQLLHSTEVNLSLTAPSKEEVVFLNPREVIFKGGTLYTSGTHKGDALFKFLDLIKEKFPSEAFDDVVFINDRLPDLQQVQESCKQRGISFTGIRYGRLDEKVKNFPRDIALKQFENFGKIISDEQAAALLGKV